MRNKYKYIPRSQRLFFFVLFSLFFCFHFYVVFDKRLITPLGTEVKFPGKLGPRCFLAVLQAVNLTSLLTARVPSYIRIGAYLSQLPMPSECAERLQPQFMDLGRQSTVMQCLLRNRVTISAADRLRLFQSLKTLRDTFRKAKLELVMEGGTLLGSLRHHGLIVYDNDFDFRIRYKQKEAARKVLLAMPPNFKFTDTEPINGHWKLGIMCQNNCRFHVDVFFWRERRYSLQMTEYPFNFLSETVYPLSKRPFEGILFDSPRHPVRMMRSYLDEPSIRECRSYDHFRRIICPGRMDCAMLEPFVPFVRKIADDRFGTVELLMQSSRLLYVFFLPK